MLDIEDPQRTIMGDPLVYREVTNYDGNNGIPEIELWPVPASAKSYTLTYRRTIAPLSASTDVPVLSGDVIAKGAQAMVCEVLAARTGDGVFVTLGQNFAAVYQELRDSLARDDIRRWGVRNTVLDVDDAPNFNDPAWLAVFRTIQASALTKIA